MKPLSYEMLSRCAGKEILINRAELEEDYGVDTSKTFEHKGILYRPIKFYVRTGLLCCEILGSKEGKPNDI